MHRENTNAYPERPRVGVGAVVIHDEKVLLVKRAGEPNKGLQFVFVPVKISISYAALRPGQCQNNFFAASSMASFNFSPSPGVTKSRISRTTRS